MALETKVEIIIILLKYLLIHLHGVFRFANKIFQILLDVKNLKMTVIPEFVSFRMILKQVLFLQHLNLVWLLLFKLLLPKIKFLYQIVSFSVLLQKTIKNHSFMELDFNCRMNLCPIQKNVFSVVNLNQV